MCLLNLILLSVVPSAVLCFVTQRWLPSDIAADIFCLSSGPSCLLTKTIRCTKRPFSFKLLLYTRSNRDDPIPLNETNPEEVDPSKKFIFIAHGWLSRPTKSGTTNLKDAYLSRYDCNVIAIDWHRTAFQKYNKAYCAVERIAERVANFICLLSRRYGVRVDTNVHVAGHSLGGQMAGIIGQGTQNICQKDLARIIAMDPAGPYYQRFDESLRLDKSDAKFVTVIHTDEGLAGYYGNCGHVDFHMNCGQKQPFCPFARKSRDVLLSALCNHAVSWKFAAEAVNSSNFIGQACADCPSKCPPDANNKFLVMGEDTPTNATGSYWVPTHFHSPYAAGCEPFPDQNCP